MPTSLDYPHAVNARDVSPRPVVLAATSDVVCDAFATPRVLPIVCIQGLGYVGAAVAIAVASARQADGSPAYNVVAVDLSNEQGLSRIAALSEGRFPFATTDAKLLAKAREVHTTGNLMACAEPRVFGAAHIVIVNVPLNVEHAEGKAVLDMQTFRSAIRSIGSHMRPDALVIIETTVPPGATSRVAAPLLREEMDRRNLPVNQFKLAHCYERVMPGRHYFDSIVNISRVYAGIDSASADACEAFLRTVINVEQFPLVRLSSTTASELAKVLENTFRAVTIALMDEWGSFAEQIGVDLLEVVDCIRSRPTHSNIRTPGFGVGGYCLTKDPLMGKLAAREIFKSEHSFPFAEMAVEINRGMPLRVLDRMKCLLKEGLKGRRILLLGVSYRQDVGDTRHSPSEVFYRAATREGAEVVLHDPLVEYWHEQDMHVAKTLPPASGLDAVVLAVPHIEYRSFDYEQWMGGSRPLFFDGFNVLTANQRSRLRALGCRVESVGRG
jgi:nucleotide sugar dehydrogenase